MLLPWRAFCSIQVTLRSRSMAATDDFLTFMSATPDPSYSSVRNSSGCRRAAPFKGGGILADDVHGCSGVTLGNLDRGRMRFGSSNPADFCEPELRRRRFSRFAGPEGSWQ